MRRIIVLVLLVLGFLGIQPSHAQSVGDVTDHAVALAQTDARQLGKRSSRTFTSARVDVAFDGVALQGFTADKALKGWIRFVDERGVPGDWQTLYLVTSATDAAFMAAYRGPEVFSGVTFDVRFETESGASLGIAEAGTFDTRLDEQAPAQEAPFPAPQKNAYDDFGIVPPVLVTRADWGAQPFIGDPIPLARPTYDYITLHHAAGFSATTREEGERQVKAIQDFHQNGRGWSDIGYQFVFDRGGNLYQGRPFLNDRTSWSQGPPLVQGAHVGGHNTGNIGVCLLGCYHPPEGPNCTQQITESALDSLVTFFAYLSERYDVDPSNIRGHRDFGSTACPGDNNYVLLPLIRERVRKLLLTGNQPIGAAALAATVDDDGVVRLSWEFIEDSGILGYRIVRVYQDSETVIYEGEGTVPDAFSDGRIVRTGQVAYRLIAFNDTGREQVLATSVVDVEAPASYVMSNNFPNPFQDHTTIRYYLEREGIVTLTVHDALGREVASLVNGSRDGGRWYAEDWDATDLASGLYFYRLQVSGFSGVEFDETKPLVVVK